jgi:hypothetical protein
VRTRNRGSSRVTPRSKSFPNRYGTGKPTNGVYAPYKDDSGKGDGNYGITGSTAFGYRITGRNGAGRVEWDSKILE